MKKIIISIVLSVTLGGIAILVMANGDDKPKKAKTEQCLEKKNCEKSCCEKSCPSKCNTGKHTVEKK